ncbi:MAG: four helix bundle protein [Ignavibacteriales bacterium]|nr:four helix bundle protein [Ignavibacteriales bacterium]
MRKNEGIRQEVLGFRKKSAGMRNFRELKIWQKGMDIVTGVYQLTSLLPKDEKFGLKTQLQRAAVSIPSNIAEGCSRNSEIDFKRFLEIAIGSTYELETQLTIVENINLVSEEKVFPMLQLLSEEQKMLNSFIASIKERSEKKYKKLPKSQNLMPKT